MIAALFGTRWQKLLRDVQMAPGRMALAALAIAAGVFGLATMLSSYTILDRETTRNYLETNPPSATLTLDRIDSALMNEIRRFPGIAAAQAGSIAGAVMKMADGRALALTIFVVGDFDAMSINLVKPEAGAWPPATGALLLERDALKLVNGKIGDMVAVRTPDGRDHPVTLAGTVHDASLPPANRGNTVYAWATPATVNALGLDGSLRQLKLQVSERPFEIEAIESTVAQLALWIRTQGRTVSKIRIPPPGEHPHQRIMNAILGLLLVFSAIALLLSAVLTATIIGGLLAQQKRQIGVMKTIGARSGQIAAMYLVLVGLIALPATLLGIYGGLAAGAAFSEVVLREILNFTMHSSAMPGWAYLALLAAGIGIPLAVAAVPVILATRTTVQAALNDFGSSRQVFSARGGWLDRLPWVDRGLLMAIRNSFRQRARLFLTLALLAVAGAMFMSSLNVRRASEQHLLDAAADRHYDLQTFLNKPEDAAAVKRIIATVPGVALVEAWNQTAVARLRADGLEIERVYPDGSHGTLAVAAVPEPNATQQLSMLSGRWLKEGEAGAAVLNAAALDFFPAVKVGEQIELSSRGRVLQVTVVGIARQNMTGATAYVTPATYAGLPGQPGYADSYRIVTLDHAGPAVDRVARAISDALARATITTRINVTETMLRKDVDGHFDILIVALLFIAILMAAVGVFGLGSAMGNSVAERRREFGILRSIGARPAVVLRNVLVEGVFTGLLSVPLALLLALPLSAAIGSFLGNLLFGLPFPLVLALKPLLLWVALVTAGALAASALPALRAARMSIHETLAYL